MAELLEFPPPMAESASSGPPGLADSLARAEALDIRRSWIVEAPAGSGKTGLLIQRYLKLLCDENVGEPEEVLALTFTHKAASEMRDRVLTSLERAAFAGDPPQNDFDRITHDLATRVLERDAERRWGLLQRPDRISLRTIDSMASEITRSLPILAGGGGRLSPVEEPETLYREAARRTLLQLGGPDHQLHLALRHVLLHRDGNLAECERLLSEMLHWREQWAELIPFDKVELTDAYLDTHVLPKLERTLDLAICKGLTKLADTFGPARLSTLAALAREMAPLPGYRDEASPIALCADRQSPEAIAEHLEHWRALIHLIFTPSTRTWRRSLNVNVVKFDLKLAPSAKAALLAFLAGLEGDDALLSVCCEMENLPPASFPPDQWEMTKNLFRLLSHALVELKLVFSERQECDFAELSIDARRALRPEQDGDEDSIAEALGIRLKHLLVDEVQDTSTAHFEFLELLTQGWDGASQTMFLVGDPKQSIYLFRQARVERFLRTVQTGKLGEISLGCLRLTANFRSQAKLVGSFNEHFSRIFPVDEDVSASEVTYSPAEAVNPSSDAAGLVWHTTLLPQGLAADTVRELKQQLALDEAQEIRRIVMDWRERPLPPGRIKPWKIAVLVSGRSHLRTIVQAFRGTAHGQAPIPYRAVRIEPLGERPEVLDLLALTRALLHPADRIAWLAVLHAPWCGLSLADLYQLAGADDAQWSSRTILQAMRELGDRLSPDGCARLERVWPILSGAAEKRDVSSAAQWVEQTWRSLRGDRYLQPEELANACAYLDLLQEVTGPAGDIDLQLLEQRVQKLYAAPSTTEDAVDLMTIHGAKGLEWDVVLVPALEKAGGRDVARLLQWEELDLTDAEASPVMLAPIAGKGEDSTSLSKWVRSLHEERLAAERKRLFYVASTRARQELHLFAAAQRNAHSELKPRSGTLLAAAWPAVEHHFLTLDELNVPERSGEVQSLAAAAPAKKPPVILRLPLADAAPPASIDLLASADVGVAAERHFVRPEGGFEARALGNAVHALLEFAAQQLNSRVRHSDLVVQLPKWRPRIVAVLRAEGLPPQLIDRKAREVETAISRTLHDEVGRWILMPRGGTSPASEYAAVSWATGAAKAQTVRIDRTFLAGERPLKAGADCRWIIDYKTTTHGSGNLPQFLRRERDKYAEKMESYAAAFGLAQVRLALYFPLLSALIWWVPGSGTDELIVPLP